MKFFVSFAALASLVSAAPASRAPTPLKVDLQMIDNSHVKATLTNNGKNNLKLFKAGSILDTASVEKAKIFAGGKDIEFDGLRLHISTQNLDESAFEHIPVGQSVEIVFDVAEVHDLSEGGRVAIQSIGALSFAAEGSTELIGSVPYESNKLETDVDGDIASAARIAFHQKRTRVQSDCTGSKLSITQTALRNCASLAQQAQRAAASGPAAKMEEYFKRSDTNTRNTVSTVFSRVAAECGSTNGGVSRYYCSDVYGACNGQVLAYTLPSASYMAYCDLYFDNLPNLTNSCHSQDKATTNIHECTHLNQIKGTDDYGGYGYNFVRGLSAAQNLNHADTYSLFANAIYVGC